MLIYPLNCAVKIDLPYYPYYHPLTHPFFHTVLWGDKSRGSLLLNPWEGTRRGESEHCTVTQSVSSLDPHSLHPRCTVKGEVWGSVVLNEGEEWALYCDSICFGLRPSHIWPSLYCERGNRDKLPVSPVRRGTGGTSEYCTVTQSISSCDPHCTVKG